MAREAWGSIRKLPSKNYQASYVWEGKRHPAPNTFPTKTMARAWLAQRRAALITGDATPATADPHPANGKTLNALFTSYMAWREENGTSPSTIRTYLSRWNAHVRDGLGTQTLRSTTPETITRWDTAKAWRSPHARRNAHIVLSAFLTWCKDQQYIEQTPMPQLGGTKVPPRKREYVVATPDQVSAIIANMPAPLGIAVDLAAWCALRFGEVAALRRKDIDLDAGVVHVRATIKRGVGGHQTRGSVKTAAGNRTVAIPPKCLKRVRRHFDEHVEPGPDALVVHMLDQPDKWLTNKSMHVFFDPACEAAGVPGMRFHDLRHTGLTMAGQAGATLAELMHRAGHSDVGAVMIYQHASRERDRQLAARLEG